MICFAGNRNVDTIPSGSQLDIEAFLLISFYSLRKKKVSPSIFLFIPCYSKDLGAAAFCPHVLNGAREVGIFSLTFVN